MRFSLDWLRQYVDVPADAEEVGRRLTAVGLNLDSFEAAGDDSLLEVEVTSNRPDCMSHVGLARELAVAFDVPLKGPETAPGESAEPPVRIEIDDPADCPRYVGKVVRGVTVGTSPDWLRSRLEAVGVRPINNVVDVTNFVLWELGQPLHAFDLATLPGGRVGVRRARAGETLVTLDGERRKLDDEVLAITDGERPIALAGVMGGLDTEVTEATRDVLIESAHFAPPRVRRGSRRLGLHTDASHRFERGADPEICGVAAERAAALLVEIAGGEAVAGIADAYPAVAEPVSGTLVRSEVCAFAGADIEAAEIDRILAVLGFAPKRREGAEAWDVTVPSWRRYDFEPDGEGRAWPADLFEEVLRHFGFDRVPAALPAMRDPDAGDWGSYPQRQAAREYLAACGYCEAINFAFLAPAAEEDVPLRWAAGDPLTVRNPVSEAYVQMRRSLLANLAASARFNQRRGAAAVRLFEIGHLFPGGEAAEVEALGLIAGGALGNPWQRSEEIDLFDLKGAVEGLAGTLGATLEARPAGIERLVPGTASELVRSDGETVGFLGQLAEGEAGPFPLYVAELDLGRLPGSAPYPQVVPPSKFPGIAIDVTLTHPIERPWAEIRAAVKEQAGDNLVGLELADRYSGEGVPEGAVNTTISLYYAAEDRSLTHDEVNAARDALAAELERRFGLG